MLEEHAQVRKGGVHRHLTRDKAACRITRRITCRIARVVSRVVSRAPKKYDIRTSTNDFPISNKNSQNERKNNEGIYKKTNLVLFFWFVAMCASLRDDIPLYIIANPEIIPFRQDPVLHLGYRWVLYGIISCGQPTTVEQSLTGHNVILKQKGPYAKKTNCLKKTQHTS